MTFIEVTTTNKEVRVINTDYITQIHITSSLVHIDILNTEGACWIDMSEWERIKPLLMPPAPTVAPALPADVIAMVRRLRDEEEGKYTYAKPDRTRAELISLLYGLVPGRVEDEDE